MKIRSLLKFNTLLLLKGGPKHGYEIMKDLEKEVDKVSTSQIYPFLNELEAQGYLAAKELGERDRKVYSLTRKGKDFVSGLLHRFESMIDVAVSPRLTMCAHCGCKIYEGGVTLHNKKFCCEHCAKFFFEHN